MAEQLATWAQAEERSLSELEAEALRAAQRVGNISSLLGILTVIFSAYAALQLYRHNRLLRRAPRVSPTTFEEMVRTNEGIQTPKPVALAITLLPSSDSIRTQVQQFLASRQWQMPIEEIKVFGIHGQEDLNYFVNELAERRMDFELKGYTEIHLFLAGPVIAGVIVGAMYDNWLPTKLYHKPTPPPPSVYVYWMPLVKVHPWQLTRADRRRRAPKGAGPRRLAKPPRKDPRSLPHRSGPVPSGDGNGSRFPRVALPSDRPETTIIHQRGSRQARRGCQPLSFPHLAGSPLRTYTQHPRGVRPLSPGRPE
ncbi:MAG TPA: hypothetical protein DEP84_07210 [Chloroflexi bacterium]|nr:hypothetical protein [Chloroflexota bacterium]